MGLKFPDDWRFEEDAPCVSQGAVAAFAKLIDKIAATASIPKDAFEAVKSRFGSAGNSSNESFARSDMEDAIQSYASNAPLFIEAAWDALQDFKEAGLAVPTLGQVNSLLTKHEVGYFIEPPNLRRTTPVAQAGAPAAAAPRQGYILGERLGGGGYGEVYRATRDTGIATFEYAMKVHAPSAFNSTEKALQRFSREVQALQKLQHRGIVPYLDAGVTEKGHPFLIMPVIEGPNLRDATSPDAPMRVANYLVEVVLALAFAHANDVMHRDLKPPNILVRASDGQPVIVDFGLAYVFDEATRESLTSAAPGSAGYIPPEVLVNPKARSPRHDVYSCGVILYELIARRLPEDPRSMTPLAKLNPAFGAIDEVVKRSMAPASERYQSALDLLEALTSMRDQLKQSGQFASR